MCVKVHMRAINCVTPAARGDMYAGGAPETVGLANQTR